MSVQLLSTTPQPGIGGGYARASQLLALAIALPVGVLAAELREAAAAAGSMQSQAANLADAVSVFKLGSGPGRLALR